MTNIFLIRHGQTEWNQQNRLQGHKNSALTATGRHQALKVRQSLDAYEVNKAYVSPLQRAKDTLDIITNGKNIEIVISNNLKEINLGPWEGKTKNETKISHPTEYNLFWNHQNEFALKGAETYYELQKRVVETLGEIFINEKENNILVVSHWIAIKVAVAYYNSTPLSELSSMPDLENGKFLTLSCLHNNITVHGI